MPHELALFAYVGDDKTPEQSRIVRLTATSRVKRRLVECNRAFPARNDLRFERREVRVAQVEQFGQ
jgi:hypothetical protein